MPFTIDIDTGGTFTDGFVTDGRTAYLCKVETTPHDLTLCFIDCIEAAAARLALDVRALLKQTAVIRYSTTVGTNTLIQRNGPRLGLMITAGCEGVVAAHPLLDPAMVATLDEAVDPDGRVTRPLQDEQVRQALEYLLDHGARALCVSLRHSDRNPAHERQVKAVVAREYPQHYLGWVQVYAAADVTIRPGLAERTNAALLTGYLHDQVAAYLYRAEDYLRDQGYTRGLLVVHNNGGVSRVVTSTALNTYNSGPVAGLYGAGCLAAGAGGHGPVITMDVGGTSLDVGVITGGGLSHNSRPIIHGMPVNVPMVEVSTFGVGGGSIARVTADGRVAVGPRSAGSQPGPAAYDLGGTEPTVTDADLVLGRLSPGHFMGGRRHLNLDRARAALQERIAGPLGIAVPEAARWVAAAATAQMAAILRAQLAERGLDPGQTVLAAYGGGSGLRCAEVGRLLGVRRVLTFPYGSTFCAQGASFMDVVHIYEARTDVADAAAWAAAARAAHAAHVRPDPAAARAAALAALRRRALHDVEAEGFTPADVELTEVAEEHPVPLQRLVATCRTFHYQPAPMPEAPGDGAAARVGERMVFWGGPPVLTPVFERDAITPGHVIRGPALVEGGDTTIAVPPGMQYRTDGLRRGVLTGVGEGAEA